MSTKKYWVDHPLLGTMWKTKSSRFGAADRLRIRAWWKGISLGILSAYVLVLSVVPKYLDIGTVDHHTDMIGLVGLAAAVLMLVLSVVSLFDEDKIRSNYMHDNARDISDLYHAYKLRLLEGEQKPTEQEIEEVRTQYQLILAKCPFNHDPIDYDKTMLSVLHDQGGVARWRTFRHVIWWIYDVYFWPVCSGVTPLVLFLWFLHI